MMALCLNGSQIAGGNKMFIIATPGPGAGWDVIFLPPGVIRLGEGKGEIIATALPTWGIAMAVVMGLAGF